MLSAIWKALTSSGAVSRPKTILLTLDGLGTLYTFRAPVAQQYIAIAKRCGFQAHLDESQLASSFKSEYARMQQEFPNYGKGQLKDPRAWWNQLTRQAFRAVVGDKQPPASLYDALYNHFESAQAYKLYPDVKPFFETLRRLRTNSSNPSIIVGLITNSDPRVNHVLSSLGLKVPKEPRGDLRPMRPFTGESSSGLEITYGENANFFARNQTSDDLNFVITSYYSGAAKPASGIFEEAEASFGICASTKAAQDAQRSQIGVVRGLNNALQDIKNSEKIHVGDDYEADYRGAEKFGWQAFHLVRDGEGKRVEGANTVSSLAEVSMALNLMVQQQKKE
jgi:FMN phosphatase YigB (HAD superfamily)